MALTHIKDSRVMFIIDNRYPGLRRSVKEQGKVDTSQDNVRWARDLENRPVKKRPVLTVLAQDKPPNSPWVNEVWPSVWTNGPNWPNDGEIGIIESVNLMPNNQIALHTTPAALTQHPKTSRGPLWSTTEVRVRGVPLRRRKGTALGLALLLHRGGVLAAQFDVSGIYIWFWSRADIPESITQLTSTSPVDTSSWGDPSSAYPPPSSRNRHHSVWSVTDDNVYGPGRSTYDVPPVLIPPVRRRPPQPQALIPQRPLTFSGVE
ncbi:glycoside hydrolase family 16 protein [Serpula lacrymans var. lacrymans S7.9]|uniref:Glycoside hydrolase family 16 protein n=1 Tax=Serpula lacrymans var. lacrymans (strain S7.9) TaxID=578457 RepID=F8P8Y8_SERL9|nr:glycoside hydrolase family 16 protein [Serpula lacrymans var. lacrymans S7.9]EGO20117.1 glycoside hydrolase family 16 protein [Serpula lacrymans var. lacrymans S7.9]